jgi:hypothetical protein
LAPRRRKQEQQLREIAEVCENTTELDMDVIEKAFEETPLYEKKLQEAREKHLGTLVDFITFGVIYEEDFVNEKALSTVWVDKSPDGNEVKSRLCARGFEQHLQKDASFFSPTPSSVSLRLVLALAHQRNCDIRFGDISAAFLHAEINDRFLVDHRRNGRDQRAPFGVPCMMEGMEGTSDPTVP